MAQWSETSSEPKKYKYSPIRLALRDRLVWAFIIITVAYLVGDLVLF